jgi:hypothetical protein
MGFYFAQKLMYRNTAESRPAELDNKEQRSYASRLKAEAVDKHHQLK